MTNKSHIANALYLVALVFLAYLILLPKNFIGIDGENWQRWSEYLFSNGLSKAYNNPDISYPPIYLYALKFFTSFSTTNQDLLNHLYLSKGIALLFDFVSACSIIYFVRQVSSQPYNILFLLLNIAYIYNSLIWWQTDSIHTAFILLSVFFALNQQLILSAILLALAINTKFNALIYMPIIFLLWVPFLKIKPKQLFMAIILGITTVVVLWLPFILENNVATFIQSITKRANYYHFVSMKAYNFWYLLLNDNPRNIDDSAKFFGLISYKAIGLWAFIIAYVSAIISLIQLSYQKYCKAQSWVEKDYLMVFITVCLITLITFYFPTRMHERYAYAAIPCLFIIASIQNNFWLYILCSVAYFFNLEKETQFLLMPNEIDNFLKPEIFATLYLIVIVALYKQLFVDCKKTIT